MVNADTLSKLIDLIKRGKVTYSQIKIDEYKNAVVTEFKTEVVAGTMTTEQYKNYIGTDYVA